MKVYVLHECIDSSDFYAEDNVIGISKTFDRLETKMFDLYLECRKSFSVTEISKDETWCDKTEASVVCGGNSYYRHHWKIDEFEV